MIGTIRKWLGIQPGVNIAEMMESGALVVDVRTPAEFKSGHFKGAVNIPLDSIQAGKHQLKDKQKPLVLCCRSGMRSASATKILKNQGFTRVVNGGAWQSLHAVTKKNK